MMASSALAGSSRRGGERRSNPSSAALRNGGGCSSRRRQPPNAVLIDCDAEYFRVILNFLRHGEISIPPGVAPRGVLAAAKYYNVQGILNHFDRDKRQAVFSWGTGGSGELGTQDKQDVLTPTQVTIVSYDTKVVGVALGANYSCILTETGRLYTFGNGDWGQLGLGSPKLFHERAEDKTPVCTVPTLVKKLEPYRVVAVATGYAYAMALTSEHEVFFWGNNNHGQSGLGASVFGSTYRKIEEPILVDTLSGKNVIQLGCGSFFVIALTAEGSVYSWGLVDCVGLGSIEAIRTRCPPEEIAESVSKDKRTVVLKPLEVFFPAVVTTSPAGGTMAAANGIAAAAGMRSPGSPAEHSRDDLGGGGFSPTPAVTRSEVPPPPTQPGAARIVRINAGQWHSCAITEAGALFTWGVGFQGRLGHGDKEPCLYPCQVLGALDGKRVVDVACGSFHTVALTAEGHVYCWGDNANGQCSSGFPEAVTRPFCVTSLQTLSGGVARVVSCGRQHTVVVMMGPHAWCQDWCCKLRHDGRPQADHGQVFVFGESKGMGLGQPQKVCSAKLVPGMERYNVQAVVSGLHHTFVLAETIPAAPF